MIRSFKIPTRFLVGAFALAALLPLGAYAQTDDRICPNADGNIDSVTVCPSPVPTSYPSYPGYAGGGGPVNGPGSNPPPSEPGYSGGGQGGQQGGQTGPNENCRSGNPIEICVVPTEYIDLLTERLKNMIPNFGPVSVNGSTVYQAGFFFFSDFRKMYRNFTFDDPSIRSPTSGIYYIYCLTPTMLEHRVMIAVGVEDLGQGMAYCRMQGGEPSYMGPYWLW